MTAYFMQELILEPYAGLVFGFTPGQSTQLSGAQNGGVFLGMLLVGIMATGFRHRRAADLGGRRLPRLGAWRWALIAALGPAGSGRPLVPAVVALGLLQRHVRGRRHRLDDGAGRRRAASRREGTRMGLWGAAQAVAAGFGGLAGAALADALPPRRSTDAPAFGSVFLVEAGAVPRRRRDGAAHHRPAPPGRRRNLVPGE